MRAKRSPSEAESKLGGFMSTTEEMFVWETIGDSGREPGISGPGISMRRRFVPVALACLTSLAMFLSPNASAQIAATSAVRQTPNKVLNGTAIYVKHYDPAQMLRLAIVLT